jgi:hypothetical protein
MLDDAFLAKSGLDPNTPLYTVPPQPEPSGEPVAWISPKNSLYRSVMEAIANGEQALVPLYTAPPQREWQGLTDKEVMQLVKTWHGSLTLASAIEAKLKEKNDLAS